MVHLITHPFVHDALATLRDTATPPDTFRRVARRMSLLIAAEVLKDIPTVEGTVETPLGTAFARRVHARVTLVPVLRAGLGMIDGILDLLPSTRVGHIGLQRDETTAQAMRYYVKLPPDLANDVVLITDPMLATGGSACAAIRYLKEAGCRDIQMICLVAAPEGVKRVHDEHPDVMVYAAALDRQLDDNAYIRPGLGDAGDRVFGPVEGDA